ncbi:mulatexin-like [Vicia villosa]|uniref:mulatexin-like n=1 Tax=Vicia villosa TaxID=3911 RepID=UPI00273BD397|nr:mulatexin-like [Vicia villosa]
MKRFAVNEFSVVVVILLAIGSSRWCLADLDPPQCGIQAGGALCRDQLCCSAWGFCGSTDVYCGVGCQSQCTGLSPPPPSPPPPSPPPPPPSPPPPPPPSPPPPPPCPPPPQEQCGRQAGGAVCRDQLCCSAWGFCGSTPIYCGDGCQSQCTGSSPPIAPALLPPPFIRPPPPPRSSSDVTYLEMNKENFLDALI